MWRKSAESTDSVTLRTRFHLFITDFNWLFCTEGSGSGFCFSSPLPSSSSASLSGFEATDVSLDPGSPELHHCSDAALRFIENDPFAGLIRMFDSPVVGLRGQ